MTDTEGIPITGERAWRGADLASTEWVTHLSANEVNALNALAHNLPSNDSEWLSHQALAQSDPSLSSMLSSASQALSHGKGSYCLEGWTPVMSSSSGRSSGLSERVLVSR